MDLVRGDHLRVPEDLADGVLAECDEAEDQGLGDRPRRGSSRSVRDVHRARASSENSTANGTKKKPTFSTAFDGVRRPRALHRVEDEEAGQQPRQPAHRAAPSTGCSGSRTRALRRHLAPRSDRERDDRARDDQVERHQQVRALAPELDRDPERQHRDRDDRQRLGAAVKGPGDHRYRDDRAERRARRSAPCSREARRLARCSTRRPRPRPGRARARRPSPRRGRVRRRPAPSRRRAPRRRARSRRAGPRSAPVPAQEDALLGQDLAVLVERAGSRRGRRRAGRARPTRRDRPSRRRTRARRPRAHRRRAASRPARRRSRRFARRRRRSRCACGTRPRRGAGRSPRRR